VVARVNEFLIICVDSGSGSQEYFTEIGRTSLSDRNDRALLYVLLERTQRKRFTTGQICFSDGLVISMLRDLLMNESKSCIMTPLLTPQVMTAS
jgi:hypothetical protein